MIESLRLQNFKGHRDTTIEFGRLTVLVGPNGSGKTSVLQALGALALRNDKPSEHIFRGNLDPQILLTRGQRGPITIHAAGHTAGAPWHIAVTCTADTDRWQFATDHDGHATHLHALTKFRFDAERIAAPAYDEDAQGRVQPDGKNTATALMTLLVANDGSFAAVEDALKRLVPSVERIRLRPAFVSGRDAFTKSAVTDDIAKLKLTGQGIVFDFKNAPDLPAHAASEGTLVLLALLTALHANGPRGAILIDDIEHSLHPTAQIELMKHLRGLLDQMPDLQIVATTHSPYILDGVDPSDVRVFYPRDDGTIVTKRLSDHPDAQRVKGMLSSGELWSAESEAWVLAEDAAQ